jgi:hypothetical protein
MIIEMKVTASDGTVLADFRTQVPDTEADTPRQQRRRSLSEKIYWFVRENPGVEAKFIAAVLGSSNKDSVSATLSEMKKRGLVENGAGEFNTWQWTVTDATPPWTEEAE